MPLYTLETLAAHVKKGPFLGLDWGKKRLGIALSDPDNHVAMPLCQLETRALGQLAQLWATHQAQALIIGWPLNMDGSEGENCQRVRLFMQRLPTAWPMSVWDERLSTQAISHLRRPHGDDPHAAAVILQGALDRWRNLIHQGETP